MASLAARCQQVHAAAEAGAPGAEARLVRLAARGPRAAQCLTDLIYAWHRHPARFDCCLDDACPEASDPAAWSAAWERWWPPGQHPGGS